MILIFREQLTDTVVVITVVVTIGVVVVDEVDDKVVEVVKTWVVEDTKSFLGVIVALVDDASWVLVTDVVFMSWTVEDVAPHEDEVASPAELISDFCV